MLGEYFLYIQKEGGKKYILNVVTDNIYAAIGARYVKNNGKVFVTYEEVFNDIKRRSVYIHYKNNIGIKRIYEFYNEPYLYYSVIVNKITHNTVRAYTSLASVNMTDNRIYVGADIFEKEYYKVKTVTNNVYTLSDY